MTVFDKRPEHNQQLDINLFVHIVPSSAEESISAKLDLILKSLEKLGAGGASAEDIAALTTRAQGEADKAKALEQLLEDLSKK